MDKIIFLDIDGVLNHQEFYKNFDYTKRNDFRKNHEDEWGDMFCPESTRLYNQLTEKTKAKTVISSTKRHIEGNLDYMKGMWKDRGFTGELIGITPFLSFKQEKTNSIPRGCEIDWWLKNKRNFNHINWSKEEQLKYMEKSNLSNYIIIDDDSDMLYGQRNHFIHVLPSPRNKSGFNERYYKEALYKLSKTVIELNY